MGILIWGQITQPDMGRLTSLYRWTVFRFHVPNPNPLSLKWNNPEPEQGFPSSFHTAAATFNPLLPHCSDGLTSRNSSSHPLEMESSYIWWDKSLIKGFSQWTLQSFCRTPINSRNISSLLSAQKQCGHMEDVLGYIRQPEPSASLFITLSTLCQQIQQHPSAAEHSGRAIVMSCFKLLMFASTRRHHSLSLSELVKGLDALLIKSFTDEKHVYAGIWRFIWPDPTSVPKFYRNPNLTYYLKRETVQDWTKLDKEFIFLSWCFSQTAALPKKELKLRGSSSVSIWVYWKHADGRLAGHS